MDRKKKKTYTLEEMADHFETVAMFGKSGKPVSMYAEAAAELRRLAEMDAAMARGELVRRGEA